MERWQVEQADHGPWLFIGASALFVTSALITSSCMSLLLRLCFATGWRSMIQQTGENGFHFVDEAAPPALMRALALEILKRRLVVELVDQRAV